MIPSFNEYGDLPVGIHRATWEEVEERFGSANAQRIVLFRQGDQYLQRLVSLKLLARVIFFGSFITAKPMPNDVDLFLVLRCRPQDMVAFTASQWRLLDPTITKLRYRVDSRWLLEDHPTSSLQSLLQQYARTREDRERGLLEVLFP